MKRVNVKLIAALCAVVFAAGLIVFGIANGQLTEVFEKARRICLECVGIG